MSREDTEIDSFWAHCTKAGIVCKPLRIRKNLRNCFSSSGYCRDHFLGPLSVIVEEPVRYGAPIISVPYESVLNVQNIRGGLVPRPVPPFSLFSRLLTRRYQEIHPLGAQGLWIAACIASYRHSINRIATEIKKKKDISLISSSTGFSVPPWYSSMAPWCTDTFFYPLASPSTSRGWRFYPGVRSLLENEKKKTSLLLPELHIQFQKYINLTFALMSCYSHKRRVPTQEVPDLPNLTLAYHTVLYRSMLLPINGEPSAPGDLNELMDAAPHLPLLTSLIPLIEHIRSIPVSNNEAEIDGAGEDGEKDAEVQTEIPNCILYTCQQSEFLSPTSRRRAVTAPTSSLFSSRKVVVCAARDLKEGEELSLGF